MERSGLYNNEVTKAWSGLQALVRARELDDQSTVKLETIIEGAPFYKIGMAREVQGQPDNVNVHGITSDAKYLIVTYNWSVQSWVVLADTTKWEDPRFAHASMLTHKVNQLKDEINETKRVTSEAQLQESLLRHELERVRANESRTNTRLAFRFRWDWFFVTLVIFLLWLPTGQAQNITKIYHETYQTNSGGHLRETTYDVLKGYAKQILTEFRVKTESGVRNLHMAMLKTWEPDQFFNMVMSYQFISTVMLAVSVLTSERAGTTALVTFVGYVSGWRLASHLPLVSPTNIGICMVTTQMLASMIGFKEQVMVFIVTMTLWLVVIYSSKDDVFLTHLRSMVLVSLANLLAVVVQTKAIPETYVFVSLMVYRITRALNSAMGDKIEIRDASGKIVKTIAGPVLTAGGKVSKFFQSKLKKHSGSPFLVRGDLCKVIGEGGTGIGFRVKNWIVTANHVVGASETARIEYSGSTEVTEVKRRLANKDIVMLKLPTICQSQGTYRTTEPIPTGNLGFTSMNDDGYYAFAITPYTLSGDDIMYALSTHDGSSGSPLTDEHGRVFGVHVSNTGFTAAGKLLIASDLEEDRKPSKKEIAMASEIEELKKQLADFLERQNQDAPKVMQQCETYYNPGPDIVALVREAIKQEMKHLRAELDQKDRGMFSTSEDEDDLPDYVQAKGKTKKGRGGRKLGRHARKAEKRRKAVWSEQEYKEMLDKGFTVSQLRVMAENIRQRMAEEEQEREEEEQRRENNPYNDEDYNHTKAYGEYEDPTPEEQAEIEREWFEYQKNNYDQCQACTTHPWDIPSKFSLVDYPITQSDEDMLEDLEWYEKALNNWTKENIIKEKDSYVFGPKADRKVPVLLWAFLESKFEQKGKLPFSQRKRQKNLKKAQVGASIKATKDQQNSK